MHYPPHYGPTPYYGRFRRGPSRLFWFFLGGAAVYFWQYKYYQSANGNGDSKFLGWCNRRLLKNRDEREGNEWRDGRQERQERQESGELGWRKTPGEPEPLWKLRTEREADQKRLAQEAEFREDMNKAREKVSFFNYYNRSTDLGE